MAGGVRWTSEQLQQYHLKQAASKRARELAARIRRDGSADGQRVCAAQPGQHNAVASARPRDKKITGGNGERYHVAWTIYTVCPADWDNAAASIKGMQDELVDLGFLPGDDWQVLEGTAKAVKVSTRAEQGVTVAITRLM